MRASGPASHGPDGASKDQPYYWTMSLTGEEYRGSGRFADMVLLFDTDGSVSVMLNGRTLMETAYSADPNSYEEQIVYFDGIFCRDGWVKELRYEPRYGRDNCLIGDLTANDGSKQEIVFHTGSEENLYIDVIDAETAPVVALP
jgi:hypothetical protein